MRRAFQHDLPAMDAATRASDLRTRIDVTVENLRPALQNAVLFLGKALGASFEDGSVFDDQAARRETSERLRRDVWMFAQIVRAFSTKRSTHRARTAGPPCTTSSTCANSWPTSAPWVTRSCVPRITRASTRSWRRCPAWEDTDLGRSGASGSRNRRMRRLPRFLLQLFEDISKRDELAGIAFDRRAAAASLRLYLGE
ncbi:MAG: hypothetical protein WDO74_24810 [Pseudomonadota bacterium]